MMDFKWRANLAICFFSLFCGVNKLEVSSTMISYHCVELDETDFLFSFKKYTYVIRTFLNYFQPQRHTGRMIVMISGIAFDHPGR